MLLEEIFYSTFWISMISVIWFYTDWLIHYCTFFGIAETTVLEYMSFVAENPTKYFPDFLYEKTLSIDNEPIKFIGKLISCPPCFHGWLAFGASIFCGNLIIAAPVYIFSLFTVLQIRKML
jgi:hypothetical protein